MARKKTVEDVADQLAVKFVSMVSARVDREGELGAYDGIEVAREMRAMMVRKFDRLRVRRPPAGEG